MDFKICPFSQEIILFSIVTFSWFYCMDAFSPCKRNHLYVELGRSPGFVSVTPLQTVLSIVHKEGPILKSTNPCGDYFPKASFLFQHIVGASKLFQAKGISYLNKHSMKCLIGRLQKSFSPFQYIKLILTFLPM